MHLSKNIKETENLAKLFLRDLSPRKSGATIVGLSGDLGSGKTAFVKAVAKALGVEHTVTSPTFVLEKIYTLSPPSLFTRLVHIDAYRLNGADEFKTIFQNDIANDPRALVFIEWPVNIGKALPVGAGRIDFRFVDETTREIEIRK